MAYDFFGHIVGKAVRRQLEKEAAQGGGPILETIKPYIGQIMQQQVGMIVHSHIESATGGADLRSIAAALSSLQAKRAGDLQDGK